MNPPESSALAPAHVAILASAGTGKTYRLSTRCVALLAAGVSPDRVLATTFTRAAAGEIMRRILARLASAALDPDAAASLGRDIGLSPAHSLSPEFWRGRLARLVREIDRFGVSTLDAFFARLAGAFALELGGALSWQPADDDTLRLARDHAIAHMLRSSDRSAMLQLIRARASGLLGRSVTAELNRAIQDAHAAVIGTERDAWDRLIVPPLLSAHDLGMAIEALAAAPIPTNKDGSPSKLWLAAMKRLEAAAREGRWEDFASDSLTQRALDPEPKFARAAFTPAFLAILAPLLSHVGSRLIGSLSRRNIATYELIRQYDEAFTHAKSILGVLAFDDVPRMLLDATLDDRLASMYYRLDASISHVLLDEFQDTSIPQWQLIEPIIAEIVSGEGADPIRSGEPAVDLHMQAPAKSFFCVGDVKQSLYGWRDAEPDLLPMVTQRWPQVRTERLALNRRSSPVIIDAVNRVFGSLTSNAALMGEDSSAGTDAAKEWEDGFEPHEAFKRVPGYACLCTSAAGADSEERRRAVLRLAAERAAAIHSRDPTASVGVLFRSKRSIPLLRHILQTNHQIAASEEGGNPLTDSPRAAEVLSLLTLIDQPASTAAAYHVAHSPLAAVIGIASHTDLDVIARVTSRLRDTLQRDGLACTIQRWAARLLASCDDRGRDRLGRLVWLAAEYERSPSASPLRLHPFIRLTETRRIEDPSAAPVRLMSIHASKGLEFDAVILPDLDARIPLRAPSVLTSRPSLDAPIDFASLCPKKDVLRFAPALAERYEQWRTRIIREEMCALYVGMTRAVHSLEMIIEPRTSPEPPLTLGGILRGALAPDPAVPETVLWQSGEADWLTCRTPDNAAEQTAHASPPLPPAIVDLRLDWVTRTRFLPVRSPSDASASRVRRLEPAPDPSRVPPRTIGVVFHAWLAAIRWIEEPLPSDDQLRALIPAESRLPADQVSSLLASFHASLAEPSLRGALARPDHAAAVYRELAFTVPTPDGLMSGRFDRVVLLRGERAEAPTVSTPSLDARIYDFKILTSRTLAAKKDKEEEYSEQLAAYEHAAAALFGVRPDRVSSTTVQIAV